MSIKTAVKKVASGVAYAIGMRSDFVEAPPFRPSINMGCLMDIPTGPFLKGVDGHWYCAGGLSHITGIGGRGNLYKSALLIYMLLKALDVFKGWIDGQSRDTEFSQTYQRFQGLAEHLSFLSQQELSTYPNFMITSQGESSGNEWFAELKTRFKNKQDAGKAATFTTPFIHPTSGQALKLLHPSIVGIDSLSMFTTDVSEGILEKNEIGDASANTVYMRASGAKSQMVMQMPQLASRSNAQIIMTAHMGDDIQIDPYAPPQKKLAFLKNKLKFKNVPENFTFLTNNLWMVTSVTVEHTREHLVTYPRDANDKTEGDTDLQRLSVVNLRAKAGPSGFPFDLIISQREGLLVPVTEFHFLKSHGRYGISGDNTRFSLDLYPDVELMRTTIRGLAYSDPLLARALTLTTELYQIKMMKPELADLVMSPKQLYKAAIDAGYDWSKILATRGYWVFQEMEGAETLPYLSVVDLLVMVKGRESHPWQAQFKADVAEIKKAA